MSSHAQSTIQNCRVKYLLSFLRVSKTQVIKLKILLNHQLKILISFARYNKNGQLAIAGFSDPLHDPKEDDLKLWVPDVDCPPPDLDLQIARFLLAQVADQFCDLLQQEREAIREHMSDGMKISTKLYCENNNCFFF